MLSTQFSTSLIALVCGIIFVALCVAVPTQAQECYTDECCQEEGLQWCSVRGIFQHCITPEQPTCEEMMIAFPKKTTSTILTAMMKGRISKKQRAAESAHVARVQKQSRDFVQCMNACSSVLEICGPNCGGNLQCTQSCEEDYSDCVVACK